VAAQYRQFQQIRQLIVLGVLIGAKQVFAVGLAKEQVFSTRQDRVKK
jgi:hypothetical protein